MNFQQDALEHLQELRKQTAIYSLRYYGVYAGYIDSQNRKQTLSHLEYMVLIGYRGIERLKLEISPETLILTPSQERQELMIQSVVTIIDRIHSR